MKEVCDAIKNFILTKLGPVLEELETEENPFPVPAEKDVIFGTVDLTRNEAKVLAAIVPDREREDSGDLGEGVIESNAVVCFAFRGLPYGKLMERMDGYAEAFRMALRTDGSLCGRVLDASAGETSYFPDAGPTHGTVTVAEIEVTVRTNERLADGADPFGGQEETHDWNG